MDYGSMIGALTNEGFSLKPSGEIVSSKGAVSGWFDGRGVRGKDGTYIDCSDIHSISMGQGAIDIRSMDGEVITIGTPNEYHISSESAKKAPQSLIDVVNCMQILYPTIAEDLFYEDVSGTEMIDMKLLGRPEKGIIPLNDKDMKMFHVDFQARLRAAGYSGRLPGKETFFDALDFFTNPSERSRNLFREWLETLVWDGIPRVRTWFKRTLGVCAPPLASCPEAEEQYIGDVTEAWLAGAIRRQFGPLKHEIVPVFIGEQGLGKGNLLRFTAGRDSWFKDTSTPISDSKKFGEAIAGRIIVELGESVQIRSGDSELVKSFISEVEDQYRMSYARKTSVHPRHFILAATSNLDTVFTDVTGNRRYFPMYCNAHDVDFKLDRDYTVDRSVGQVEVEQLWAEAYHMTVKEGRKAYLSEETKRLATIVQEYGAVENHAVTVINRYLDNPQNGYAEVGARISKELVLEEIFGVNPEGLVSPEVISAWRAWTYAQKCWQRGGQARVNGKNCRAYIRAVPAGLMENEFLKEYRSRHDLDDNLDRESLVRRVAEPPRMGPVTDFEDPTPQELAPMIPILTQEAVDWGEAESADVDLSHDEEDGGFEGGMAVLYRLYRRMDWNMDMNYITIPSQELGRKEVDLLLEEGLIIDHGSKGLVTMWCPAYGDEW